MSLISLGFSLLLSPTKTRITYRDGHIVDTFGPIMAAG
jgi:hypothetical protein